MIPTENKFESKTPYKKFIQWLRRKKKHDEIFLIYPLKGTVDNRLCHSYSTYNLVFSRKWP